MGAFIYILIGFLSGFLCTSLIAGFLKYFFVVLLILFYFLLYFTGKYKRSSFILLCLFILWGAASGILGEETYKSDYKSIDGKKVVFKGVIVSGPDIRDKGIYYLFKTGKGHYLIRLYVKDKKTIYKYGDEIEVSFILEKPTGIRNPGGFDYEKYLRTVSASATGSADMVKKTGSRPDNYFIYWSSGIRDGISGLIRKYIPPEKSGAVEGMLLGITDNISGDTEDDFRRSGISHLLTVSGGHAVFFLVPVAFLLKKFKVGRKPANIIEIICLVFFAFITGLGVAVCRAVIMMTIIRMGYIFRKRTDNLNSLCAAAAGLLLYNPYYIYSAGFQLSFAAVLSLIILPVHFNKVINGVPLIRSLPETIRKALAVSLSAQIGVFPVVLFLFYKTSIISVITNLVVSPLVLILFISGFCSIVLSAAGIRVLGSIFTYFLYAISYFIESAAHVLSNLKISEAIISFSLFNLIFYYLSILILIKGRSKNKFILLLFTLFFAFLPVNSFYGGLEMTFIDVGQGDSILLRLPDKSNILIDTGTSGKETEGVLRHKSVSRIDELILTHAHSDHIGGAAYIINNFNIRRIIIPQTRENEGFDEIISLARVRKIPLMIAGGGVRMSFRAGISIDILGPLPGKITDYSLNNGSLVLKLHYKNVESIFTGDIEEKAEGDLLEQYDDGIFNSAVLKVPHHGSSTSMTGDFLSRISPEVSIVSVGENNKFGHPSGKTIDKLDDCSKVYRTDVYGAVLINTDGDKLKINYMRKG